MSLSIRPFRIADAPALLALFRDTIRRVNSRDYSPEQITAWASDEIDEAAWASRFEGRFVAVAEADGRIAGFGELEPNGHIDRFFVSADHQGLGIGRALLEAIEVEARRIGLRQLDADVSLTAVPFFERRGFETRSPQIVTLRGVEFHNVKMTRALDG
ncbi:GNAT family N-acetyltransferase [Tautonia rosea]|uniref:GNAT family N-acetyltransferase n=1 Tax=Tautonia rosea TaxID=2728037 RepID=UPI001475A244|nr:GNAT family N-acetyltransferase [Tautonia rosea]